MTNPAPTPRRRTSRGFTLLEIMATVAIVGLSAGFILTAREGAANHAFRAYHMMEAIRLAEHHLAEWTLNPDLVEAQQGLFQIDGDTVGEGIYSYEITVEIFDLSTGRPLDDEDGNPLDDPLAANYGDSSGPTSLFGGSEDTEEEDDPYLVRRIQMTVYYPNPVDEEPEELILERFLPLVDEPEENLR